MRVVFLTHNYPRRPGDLPGSSLATLARAVMRRGHSVRVVVPSDEAGEIQVDGVPVHQVRVTRAMGEVISSDDRIAAALRSPLGWLALRRLWMALKTAASREVAGGAEIFHAHGWLPAGLAAPPGTPVVLTVSAGDAGLLRESRLLRSLAHSLMQRASVITAVSRQVGDWVQTASGRFVDAHQIHPMPVDTRAFPWTRGGAGAVVISPLLASQRVDLAIEAAAVLASCGHHLPLTIVGEGPERSALEQRAVRLGISSLVRFSTARSGTEARAFLERADLLLFTAREDGGALAVVEALVAGVPVVASWDSGAAVGIVPESGPGRLTLPSPESIADSVMDLQADPDRLAMARLLGESWRARLAPDNVAELCEGWYRNALAS